MVEILCPPCEEEIGLDDDAVGEFGCPYCSENFTWGGLLDDGESADLFIGRVSGLVLEFPIFSLLWHGAQGYCLVINSF